MLVAEEARHHGVVMKQIALEPLEDLIERGRLRLLGIDAARDQKKPEQHS